MTPEWAWGDSMGRGVSVAQILARHPGLTTFPVKTILPSTAGDARNPAPASVATEPRQ